MKMFWKYFHAYYTADILVRYCYGMKRLYTDGLLTYYY